MIVMDLDPENYDRDIKKTESIRKLINKEFKRDLDLRLKQFEVIQQRLNQAQKTLHVLRYCIVSSYYNNADRNVSPAPEIEDNAVTNESAPKRLHPAVKKLLTGFTAETKLNASGKLKTRRSKQTLPKLATDVTEPKSTHLVKNPSVEITGISTYSTRNPVELDEVATKSIANSLIEHSTINNETNFIEQNEKYQVIRNRNKKDYIIVVGNISKWMPGENEEDRLTHKWMVYVRGPKSNPNISHFVQKVVFYLHPSYKPNDVVEVKDQPFHLSRRGWGEFPLRVRIYFLNESNKPVDIVHQLKLDQTFSGRQTLGNETVVNLQLYVIGDIAKCDTIVNEEHHANDDFKCETVVKEEYHVDDDFKCDTVVNEEHRVDDDFKCKTVVKEEHHINDSYAEHDYPHLQIKLEFPEENVSIVDLDHAYCSRGPVEPIAEQIKQPENELIYGLDDTNSGCSQSAVEESLLDTDILKMSPKRQVNYITPSKHKRKLEEPLIKRLFQKKKKMYDSTIECSNRFRLKFIKQRYKNVLQILPFLFKHLPLITKLAQNNIYKCAYPYVAACLDEYSSWNIGKRLSSEWFQAKTILNIIAMNEFPDSPNWTVKKMIMYARSHGYTPLANYAIFKGNPPDYMYDYIPNGDVVADVKPVELNDEMVEVMDHNKVSEVPEKYTKVTQVFDLNLQKTSSFIRHAVLDVGVILKPEEIMPGVLFSAAERVLLQAVLCLAEDLIRKARARLVHEGNFKEDSSIITTSHICEAITSRSEFSFLLPSDVE